MRKISEIIIHCAATPEGKSFRPHTTAAAQQQDFEPIPQSLSGEPEAKGDV